MTEVWQYSIPITIAAAGFFHFLLANMFTGERAHKPLVWSWIFFGFLLILASTMVVHLLALNTVNPDLTNITRASYIITLVSLSWSALYLIGKGIQGVIEFMAESGLKWRK